MAEQIIISGPGQDTLKTGAQKINAAILELALKIVNAGGVPSIRAGLIEQRPAATGSGAIYIATDQAERRFYRDTGINIWTVIGEKDPDWNNILQKPEAFPPAEHALSHSSAGSDPIPPEMIGAITLAALTWANILDKPSTFTPAFHKGTHMVGQSDALTPGDIGAATVESLNQKADKAGSIFTGNVLFRQEIQIGDSETKLVKAADGVVDFQFNTTPNFLKVGGKTILTTSNFPMMFYDRNHAETSKYMYSTGPPYLIKSFKVAKASSCGLNIKKLGIVAELWLVVSGGTAFLEILVDDVLKLELYTSSATPGSIVLGEIDVNDWADNSIHKIDLRIKLKFTQQERIYQRFTELYVGVM